MSPGAVTSVVFDVGGVLLDWSPRYLYRHLIADPAELDRFLTEVCTPAWNAELDAGRSFDEACADLAARHPDVADLIHAYRRQSEMVAGPVPGSFEIVERLLAAGVPIYLLTNAPRPMFDERLEEFPIFGRFHGAVVSGDEGVLKPGPDIFAIAVERFGLDPSATLFIDDVEANVEGARRVGFVGHRFVDAATLAAELESLGLLDPVSLPRRPPG